MNYIKFFPYKGEKYGKELDNKDKRIDKEELKSEYKTKETSEKCDDNNME